MFLKKTSIRRKKYNFFGLYSKKVATFSDYVPKNHKNLT